MNVALKNVDCLEALKLMAPNSADAAVTDPPYGINAVKNTRDGHTNWDKEIPPLNVWEEVLRIVKPGAHMLAFGAAKTHHRLMCNIEDAGWEIRDCLGWVYRTGMPKCGKAKFDEGEYAGWAVNLKPNWDPIVLARKKIDQKSVVDNMNTWSTGMLNIDASRVATDKKRILNTYSPDKYKNKSGESNLYKNLHHSAYAYQGLTDLGRWPANVITDGSQDVEMDIPLAKKFFFHPKAQGDERAGNPHPTVKPVALMEYLVKLITPVGGHVVDPFMGSGSTGVACVNQGFDFTGFEINGSYFSIAEKRIQERS